MSNRTARPSGVIDDLIGLPVDDVAERLRRGVLVSLAANCLVLFLSFVATNLALMKHATLVPPPLNLTFEEMKATPPTPEKAPPTPAPKPQQPEPRVAQREKPRPIEKPREKPKPVKVAEAPKPIPRLVPKRPLSPSPSVEAAPATLGSTVPEANVSPLVPALGRSAPASPAAALAGGSAPALKVSVRLRGGRIDRLAHDHGGPRGVGGDAEVAHCA